MSRIINTSGAALAAGTAAVILAVPAIAAPTPSGPPSGSQKLQTKALAGGVNYARYSNAKMTPTQIVNYYQSQLRSQGWKTVNEGGGGSGWSSGWGGGGGGLTAIKTGTYFSVNAGGDGTPTYFEVCSGPNSQIVDNCQNVSQNASNTSGS
ncbi:MAG: hypothetical protein PHU75_06450 [Candidatus Nanopelagicales bacterium]|nr:hypothetical protein [Candidatus Nanopelagicales bacterium]